MDFPLAPAGRSDFAYLTSRIAANQIRLFWRTPSHKRNRKRLALGIDQVVAVHLCVVMDHPIGFRFRSILLGDILLEDVILKAFFPVLVIILLPNGFGPSGIASRSLVPFSKFR